MWIILLNQRKLTLHVEQSNDSPRLVHLWQKLSFVCSLLILPGRLCEQAQLLDPSNTTEAERFNLLSFIHWSWHGSGENLLTYTQMDISQRIAGLLWSKMAFFQEGVTDSKSGVTSLNSFNPYRAWLDSYNEVHHVSELPLVPKWPDVKFGRTKKNIRPSTYLNGWVFFDRSTLTAGHFGTSGSSETWYKVTMI